MERGISLGSFDTQLGIVYSRHASASLDKDHWIVKKQFHFLIDGDPNKLVIVPKGFLTDGASVPRIFWGFIPPWGAYGQAAVLHDYLCENLHYYDYGLKTSITRKRADLIFKTAMEELGVKKGIRTSMYSAVRTYAAFAKLGKPENYTKKQQLEKEILSVFERTKIWI